MISYLFIKYDTIYSVIGKDRVSYKEGFNVQTPIIASWRLCHRFGDVPSSQSVSAHKLHISSLQTSVSNWLYSLDSDVGTTSYAVVVFFFVFFF